MTHQKNRPQLIKNRNTLKYIQELLSESDTFQGNISNNVDLIITDEIKSRFIKEIKCLCIEELNELIEDLEEDGDLHELYSIIDMFEGTYEAGRSIQTNITKDFFKNKYLELGESGIEIENKIISYINEGRSKYTSEYSKLVSEAKKISIQMAYLENLERLATLSF